MKTLIFVGSPKRKGHTMALVNEVRRFLEGDVEIINVFDYQHVKPCIDCGYCKTKPGCSIKDDFNEVLMKIEAADSFIIATPMWFGTMSGPMLSFFSRLQTISCGLIFRKDIEHKWDKAGVFIMTTGNKWHLMGKAVEPTAEFIFNHLDALTIDFVYANNTDEHHAGNNKQAIIKCRMCAERINEWYQKKVKGEYYQYGYSSVNYMKIEDNLMSD